MNIYVGNLNSLRTFADVRDAVRAYYLLLTKNPIPGEIYNIGGNTVVTVGGILKDLISRSKINIKTKIDKSLIRPIDVTLQIPNAKKFFKDTKWKPKMKLKESLDDLLNYRRKINYKKK